MVELLDAAVVAHGGWERWKRLNRLTVLASVKGALWRAKGHADALANVRIIADLHRQHVEYSPFGSPGRSSVYEPNRTAIVTDEGETVASRENPRQAFAGHQFTTAWDEQHLAYFSGYAMWTYLTTPFLLKLPGFQSEEIEPWIENDETWRRLKVRFPDRVHSHGAEQIFYFDAGNILRRHDYSVDVLGGTSSANYALEPKIFGGIVIPTKRRVYSKGADNLPIPERLAITIDLHDVSVA